MMNNVFSLSDDEVRALDLYWRAANYLGAAQIYLRDNCLLTDRCNLTSISILGRLFSMRVCARLVSLRQAI